MSVTCGFYNSIDGDRRYNAEQLTSLVDGIIRDGVFMEIGDALMVSASTGMNVIVGTGRAWFNSTWTHNDSLLPLAVDPAEIILNRIDAVVLEVNRSMDVRENTIKMVKGTPASVPVPPTLIKSELVNQYALAHVYVGAGVTQITAANITNKVGTDDCPFVTGSLHSGVDTEARASIAQLESQYSDIATQKADKTYVDNQIANVANGSPKGVYATVEDLQTAFPTGTTGIYVVTADGKWYYWNGSAWTAGGVYQATALETDKTLTVSGAAADAKVTGDKLDPLYDDRNKPFIGFAIGSFEGSGNVENPKRVRTNKQLFQNCDLVEFTWDSTLEVRIGAWHIESVGGVDTDVWDGWQNDWGADHLYTTGDRKYKALIRYKNDIDHVMTDADVTFVQNHIYVTTKVVSYKAPDTELNAKIEKVKEDLTNKLIALSDIYNYTSSGGFSVYEIGSFDGATDIESNKRIRTDYQFIKTDAVRITFDSSLEVRIACFTDGTPKTYEGMANNWGETVIVVKGGKNIRALIRYKDDIDHVMTDEDVAFVESHVYVESGMKEYDVYEEETVYDSGIKRKAPTWRIGTINVTTGQNENSTTRIRSSVFIKLDQTNGSISLVSTDQSLSARVMVYGEGNNNSFEKYMSGWAQESPKLPTDKYLRIVIRYNDNRTLNDSMIDAMVSAFRFRVSSDVHESRYDLFEGKTVAIFGDSISTTGYNYIDEESQVPELIITDKDVDEEAELKVWLTYRDFHPYAGNGVPPEDTTEENPCNGTNVHDLILGGVTYHYEFTAAADGGDDIPYVTYTIDGVAHKDVLGTQEYTFIPTAADVGKHFGQADNHNQEDALPNWWQLAQKELHFIPLNACFSGSCVSRARNSGDDESPRQQQHGSHSWNIGQIRRCGRRIPGTMNRESPDVIIIYRGTNDYGSPQNGQHPRVGTDILETNQNLQTYFEQNKDLVGIVRSNGTIVPIGSPSQAGDRELYGFTEAYLLTIMRLQKAYPFAKIFCCTLNAIKRTTTTNSNYPLRNSAGTLAQWNNAIRKVAEFTGCGVIDFGSDGFNFFNCQIYYPEAPNTGVHPYRDGQVVMANRAIADLKAQYGEMFNEWKSIKELLDDTSVTACSDDTGFPTSDPRGAYQYVQGKIKAHCIWDGETTIG